MKKLLWLALALAAGLIFTGCPKSSSRGVFTVALAEDIVAVDPGLAWSYNTNQVTNQITEGLVTFDASGNIVPALAKSWRQADELTYVYDVRDDIVFSDGSKMTMDDVLFSFERARDPEGGTWFSDFFDDVDYFSVDGWQFGIKLKQPSAVFKYVPATGAGRVISKDYYRKNPAAFGSAAGGIVATGPFAYEKWTSGQEIVLKKNTRYWDKAKRDGIVVDTLVFRVIPEDTTRVIALQTGNADFTVNVPADMLGQLSADPGLNHASVDSFHQTYLAFNTQRPPMNDVNVRRAIFRAVNLPEFHRNIIKDLGAAGTVLPFGPALYGGDAAKWQQYLAKAQGDFSYDIEAARQLLSRSAHPGGFACDVVVSENSLVNQRALFLQESLKPLGITVNIRRMSGEEQDKHQIGNVRDSNGFRDYDMLFGGWEADYPDINSMIETMYTSSQAGEDGYNAAAYVNPTVDRLLDAQRTTVDPALRFEIQSQLMDIVVNDAAYMVFDYSKRHSVLNKKYSGVSISPAWLWVLPMENIRSAD